jgi:hypothetical protein
MSDERCAAGKRLIAYKLQTGHVLFRYDRVSLPDGMQKQVAASIVA